MEIDKEWLKGYVDIIILSLLATRSMYGYLLSKEIKKMSGGIFNMKESTLYLSLKRLEKKELANSYWSDETEGGRRKVYEITEQGVYFYQGKKKEWEHFKTVIDLFMRGETHVNNQP
ncbi:PadR family transcriptional regulator [Heyndrickxia oleronia]|uniref:PadR family transcriptional regulator n=1 Tax=Heyndrickxia oleronia TaxID=38875 RepID=UPI00242ABADF|nr:PadR family transcriptional regulator [Heyndrickxia oleronia]MCI1590844.1 PadR family transcriptional regulator [Heyndrickxia oleronia]MCI1613955.1 PadR family transcriptional regulator [Heyndrickxia oleronia]MCI1745190.1 PadR family transcriptional regulator [Heyndrickxia oleronia]MCI1760928.1 PadR family transcriptional regulator [Heyndrickxia oleronia]